MTTQSDCQHPIGPLDIETQAGGYIRAVCHVCGLEGPWRNGLNLTAIRALHGLAKRQRKVLPASMSGDDGEAGYRTRKARSPTLF